jgi:putative transposase
VDQAGNLLDLLVPRRREKMAAKKFLRKLLPGLADVPRLIGTATLASYGAAQRERLPSVEPRQPRDRNQRAEHAHQPARQRERRLGRFKAPGHAPRFLAAAGPIPSHCRPRRHRCPAHADRQEMPQRFQTWREITGTTMAASGMSAP